MDNLAASLANALLGKDLLSPVLELHFPASQFLFNKSCIVCLTGADFLPSINNNPVPLYQPMFVPEGTALQFEGLKKGNRCYLSIYNELLLQPWLNSFITNLKAGAGGLKGRKLPKNDVVEYGDILLAKNNAFSLLPWRHPPKETYDNRVEFITGNEWNWLNKLYKTC